MNKKTSSAVRGAAYLIMSAFCFALMAAFVRLAGDIPSMQKAFFRNAVAALFAWTAICREHISFRGLNGKDFLFLVLRSTAGTIGLLGNFYAVDHMLLADASVLQKLSPFFVMIFSTFILSERATFVQYLGVATAFAASVLVAKPNFADMAANLPATVAIIGAMGAGLASTMVRLLSKRGVAGPLIIAFFSSFSCLIVLPWMIFDFHPMTGRQLMFLLLTGLAGAGGQFALTAAYGSAPAREISVYDYTHVLFSALFGFFIFSQVPDGWSVVGYLIIIGVSVISYIRGHRHEASHLEGS